MRNLILTVISINLFVYGENKETESGFGKDLLELMKAVPQIQLQIVHVISEKQTRNQSLDMNEKLIQQQIGNSTQNRLKRDQEVQVEQIKKIVKDNGNGSKQIVIVKQNKGPHMSQFVKVEQFRDSKITQNMEKPQPPQEPMPHMQQQPPQKPMPHMQQQPPQKPMPHMQQQPPQEPMPHMQQQPPQEPMPHMQQQPPQEPMPHMQQQSEPEIKQKAIVY